MFDLMITGGIVIDGSGRPAFPADIGVSGDRIVAIGDLTGREAGQTLTAAGCYVTPGFIDMHTHSDETVFLTPAEAYSHISSRLVKEIFIHGGSVKGLVPPVVEARLRQKVFSK